MYQEEIGNALANAMCHPLNFHENEKQFLGRRVTTSAGPSRPTSTWGRLALAQELEANL